jgi:glycoside/pentoside/hexuronide:cation symporter, GPH family
VTHPGWRALAAYGAPGLPLAALTLPVYVLLPAFYLQHTQLSQTAIGLILLFIRVFDGFTDPVAGYLSDRTPARLGRRRVWMLAALPVCCLAVWMVFVPPATAGAVYFALWMAVLTIGWTMMIVPYNAWGAELSDDYHVRSQVTAVREALVVTGTLVALILPAVVAQQGGSAAEGLRTLALFTVCGLAAAVLVCAVCVPDRAPLRSGGLSLKEGLPFVAANTAFRRLILAFFLNGFANGLPATLFILFVAHALGRPDMQGPLLILYFLCGVVSVPFWVWAAKRWSKHRVWCAAMLWACAFFLLTPFVAHDGGLWGFVAICVLTGASLGADLVLPGSMQADVIDADEAASGVQRAGLYFAFWGVATKLALAAAIGISFPLLDAMGFDAGVTAQNPDALMTLVALYALMPVALKLGAIALMWRFPIDRAAHDALRARIAVRRTV